MKDYITITYRKSIFLSIILKIKQYFFLRKCKKQFKKDLKNDVYFTRLRENHPGSNFNVKEYFNKEFEK